MNINDIKGGDILTEAEAFLFLLNLFKKRGWHRAYIVAITHPNREHTSVINFGKIWDLIEECADKKFHFRVLNTL